MEDERRRDGTQHALVRAASSIVRERGAGSLTLDAVAAVAGVSKGGLLYHFATKDALVRAMVEEGLRQFELDVDAAAESELPGQGRWLRSFVKVTFAARPEHDVSAGLMAAAALNPELLALVDEYFARWQDRATAGGIDPAFATLIRLAADGLWFADLFDAAPPGNALRNRVLEMLLAQIESAESADSLRS